MAGRVLVTGGGRGIGAGIVRALAEAGHGVDFTYNASKEEAEALAASLPGEGRALPCDLSERAAVDAFAEQLEEGDGYYGFVHNAGRSYDTLAATVEVDKAADAMQVNFFSMLRLIRAVIRPMMQARAGRIVAIGSVTSMRGNQGNGVYAATKGAIQSYCTTLAVEVARRGITVNTIAPGYVDTDMLAPYAGFRDKLEKQIPAQRYAQAGDVAALVRFLMSEEAGYLTGATLPVDGGLMASIGIQR